MDLICKSIISALWLSNDMRKDTRINICLNGEPDPPLTIKLDGSSLKRVSPDERNIATWLKKCLRYRDVVEDGWMETHDGIYLSKLDINKLLEKISHHPLYLLERKGDDIRDLKVEKDPIFILGDHKGFPKKILKKCEEMGVEKISVGPREYFTSHSVTLVHNEIDRREKTF